MARCLAAVVVLLVIGAVVFFATGQAHERADFTFINRGSVVTLDPAQMSWMQDIRLALTVWEGLYTYDPRTTAPIPGSAYAAEISPDRRTYTFRIRPEACWHNGESLTAQDFIYAWRRANEPGTARDYAFFFDLIEGFGAYKAWRLEETTRIGQIENRADQRAARDAHLAEADRRFEADVCVRALDERTIQVKLVRPVPYFLDLCAFSVFLPVHRKSVDRFKIVSDDGLIYYNEQWVKPGNALYNGPFYITDWVFKRYTRMAKNPHYWNHGNVKLGTVEMIDCEDRNTSWLLYSSGAVDWLAEATVMDYTPKLIAASNSPLEGALNKSGTERHDIHSFSAFGTEFYNFNCKERLPDGSPNPFRDPRVRRAFTMAVDRQKLIDRVVRKSNPLATTIIPPGSIPGYPLVSGLQYDPQQAARLLAEAVFQGVNGFPEVVILYNTGFQHGDIAQAVIRMWQDVLGVSGRTQGKEIKTFAEDKKNTSFIVCRASWFGDYGDPTTFLELFKTDNGNNDSAYSDARYDRMLTEAEELADPRQRLDKLAEAERYLSNESLPFLPLYQYVNVFAFDPDHVKNLYLTPRMMTMLHTVEVVK